MAFSLSSSRHYYYHIITNIFFIYIFFSWHITACIISTLISHLYSFLNGTVLPSVRAPWYIIIITYHRSKYAKTNELFDRWIPFLKLIEFPFETVIFFSCFFLLINAFIKQLPNNGQIFFQHYSSYIERFPRVFF